MSDPTSTVAPKEHPTHFIRAGMVTIQVEDTLFRIPQHFLTHDSPYFADLLQDNNPDDVVYVKAGDVSSSAFSNLVSVLRPPLGVTPISTLTEWTDVLHISTKWGFEHLRTAAIAAILPLASAVDKLVLGRAYDFSDWVPGAYGDLLAREDDLTLEEAEKMALKDVVAIARGRREARTQKVRPRGEIDNIVKALLSDAGGSTDVIIAASHSSSSDVLSTSSKSTPSKTISLAPEQDNDHDRAQISRWVDQLKTKPGSQSPQQCLLKFAQQDRTHIPLVLDHFITRGLTSFIAAPNVRHEETSGVDYLGRSLNCGWIVNLDGGIYRDLHNLDRQNSSLGLINTEHLTSACLRAINHWHFLSELQLDMALSDLTTGQPWKNFIRSAQYLAFLVDGGAIDASLQSSALSAKHVRIFSALLNSVKVHVSRREVGIEMDAFYQKLECARDAAQSSSDDGEVRDLIQALTDILEGRHWP